VLRENDPNNVRQALDAISRQLNQATRGTNQMLVLAKASWAKSVVTGVGLGVILFVLFDKVLDVVLPWGVLKGLSSLRM
jgi:hypothetical protein